MTATERRTPYAPAPAPERLPGDADPDLERARRKYRLNTRVIPALRGVGLALLSVGVAVHNALVLGEVRWSSVLAFAGGAALYALVSWIVLHRWYRSDARVDLGVVFLVLDLVPWAVAVYLTGADQSWIFWIFLLRVADQTTTSFRRTLAFSVLGVAAYLGVVLYAAAVGPVAWTTELAKLLFLLLAGLYMALGSRPAERMRKRLAASLRASRQSAAELAAQSEQLERAREQAEAGSRAKSEFLSRVSHELRTPMNAILGFSQLLELESLSDDQRAYVREILESGRHLLDVINEVLDISRVETGALARDLHPVHLGRAIQDVLERADAAAAARQVTLPRVAPPGSDAWVEASERKLRQVLANLISNAIKYNSSPGRVAVSCEIGNGRARISITDTGPGLAAEDIEAAFTPFQRLRADEQTPGTGLGLSVARSLVQAMGGDIGVDTGEGAGSTFWIDLALTGPPAEKDHATESTDAGERLGPLVLYIEDRPENVVLVRRILARRPGVELIDVPVGLQGLELARTRLPDLILLDLELPDVAGSEVMARLREDATTRHIPVVVVSAAAAPERIERLLAGGAKAYLTMPYDVGQFLSVVDEVLALA